MHCFPLEAKKRNKTATLFNFLLIAPDTHHKLPWRTKDSKIHVPGSAPPLIP